MATVTQIGAGAYRVDDEGKQTVVYVAGGAGDRWVFCDGEIYRERSGGDEEQHRSGPVEGGHYELSAPMPATVVKILATAGQTVKQGETIVVLEAMKMELPIRAPADAVVQAVHCREGELVQPERTLVELA